MVFIGGSAKQCKQHTNHQAVGNTLSQFSNVVKKVTHLLFTLSRDIQCLSNVPGLEWCGSVYLSFFR
ncbi:hypothetical protein CH366_16140 [Leptospira harrisiae]|uniref:Uncharacterized protein n=1 Tax=Leptospira harrisiae TaxID=2023189 RepID=A0A2N0AIS7_9LEPT|nr:hypothetical protein CH364_12820 [Leptospira harrisiae]PKA07880.1 hypothetical protein CH366_16140 [Leptospira harrisiae]